MSDRARPIELLLFLLLREEEALLHLVQLAGREQAALISSDYALIESVSLEMADAAKALEGLERERETLMEAIGCGRGSVTDVSELAIQAGIAGFEPVRVRLLHAASELRDAQERNARLLLSAAKMRERWLSLLAGMASSTYGSEGRQELHQSRRFVSKSA